MSIVRQISFLSNLPLASQNLPLQAAQLQRCRQPQDRPQLLLHAQLGAVHAASAGITRPTYINSTREPYLQDWSWVQRQHLTQVHTRQQHQALQQTSQHDEQQRRQWQQLKQENTASGHVDVFVISPAQRTESMTGTSLVKAYLLALQQHVQQHKQWQTIRDRHEAQGLTAQPSGNGSRVSDSSSVRIGGAPASPACCENQWQHLLQHTQAAMQQLQPQQASLIIYTIAKLGRHAPLSLLDGISQQLQQPQLQQLPPAGITNVIWALAVLNHQPPDCTKWFSSFYDVSINVLRQKQFNHHQLTSLLWSVGQLRQHPPAAWVAAVLAALQPDLGLLTPTQLMNSIWGLSQIGYRPDRPWCKAWFRASYAALPLCNQHHLACMIGSLGLLRLSTANGRWLVCFRRCVQHQLLVLEAGHVATIMCGLAKQLSSQPPHWVTLLVRRQLQLLQQQPVAVHQTTAPTYQGASKAAAEASSTVSMIDAAQQHKQHQRYRRAADTAATVWSLPRLLYPLPRSWGTNATNAAYLRMLAAISLPLLPACSAAELVQLAVGFAGLSFHPGTHWLKVHENAIAVKYAQLTEHNKARLRAAVKKLWLGG